MGKWNGSLVSCLGILAFTAASAKAGDAVMTWESGFVDIPDGRIAFYRTGGNHSPLLLAHGGVDNGLGWSRVASVLQKNFDIVMVDLRSHGRSSRVPPEIEDPSADDLAAVPIETMPTPAVNMTRKDQ